MPDTATAPDKFMVLGKATMRLVDSADEQQMLQDMLESSKPPLPPQAIGLHCLLAAPFRYVPQTGSRFRAVNSPGICMDSLFVGACHRPCVRGGF